MAKKKLIEVALPLDAINAQSAREKSIRLGHPSTMHLWWSRKPTATARAVLFAQLVDDPSAHEQEYRAEAERAGATDAEDVTQKRILAERERLFSLIERMVDWNNLEDEALFDAVRAEIRKSTGGSPPVILDPFAGGGTIPLEAQRLGLEAFASDLNPVAVLITKALVEIPPRFAGSNPVFPNASGERNDWPGASGLAEDITRYGAWMREEADRRIGHLYPKAILEDGTTATAIAWIWARTVKCPNPACGIEMPLVSKWSLGRKKGKEAFVVPTVHGDRVEYSIGMGLASAPVPDGTMIRGGAMCVKCNTVAPLDYVRLEAQHGRMGAVLTATVAAGQRKRIYVSPTDRDRAAARVERPSDVPQQLITVPNHDVDRLPMYGMPHWSDAFTSRQLVALTTFSDLVMEAREHVLRDALAAGMEGDVRPLEEGGTGGVAYADAVATYLGLVVSRLTDYSSTVTTWASNPQMEILRNVFARQLIPMSWDFAEGNPLAGSSGGLDIMIRAVSRAVEKAPSGGRAVPTAQADATSLNYTGMVLSTDPPYYDNIGYSDLSDFFYVWLRRSLRGVYPRLLSTMLVPKAEELVANAYRHQDAAGARVFFESGFQRMFTAARAGASDEYPITVYYAFKQTESDDKGEVSTGWQAILAAIVESGWMVTATWPMRSERGGRMLSIGTNSLASSIVLALRPRSESASIIDRRGFVAELRATLPNALRDLQLGSIAPVDLAQASIGPGMAVYSKYSEVIEPNGARMPVRAALQQINAILAEVLSAQEGDFDADTRWCVAWFEGRGFDEGPFGEAEVLASAKGASVDGVRRSGAIRARGGKVALISPGALPVSYDPRNDDRVTLWELVMHLSREMSGDGGGVEGAGRLLARAEERGIDTSAAHELAYLLFAICERKAWTAPGILFNAVGSSWPEIRAAAHDARPHLDSSDGQLSFDLDEEA